MRDLALAAVVAGVSIYAGLGSGLAQGIRVVPNEAQRRVDITVDGQPFTSYIWARVAEETRLVSADCRRGNHRYPRLSA
jgi:hypothetical protein